MKIATHQIEQIPPDLLIPWARNARTHSKKQIVSLRRGPSDASGDVRVRD